MSRTIKNKSFLLIEFCLILSAQISLAYSVPTHQDITRASVLRANIDSDLETNLAISLNDSFTDLASGQSQTGDAWIVDGSAFEDNGLRALNHFHNPLMNQGLTDPVPVGNQSAVTWAISDQRNEWSWIKARSYLYNALTSEDETVRSDQFAKTFRALGQVIHLIQDASVSEHVRNDQHVHTLIPIFGWQAYEPWVSMNVNPLNFNASAFSFPPNFPLQNFWDADTYIDSPLQQGPFTGIAEFTNYNFFSEDTIFTERLPNTDKHYFPHPRKEFTNAVLIEETAEDGQKDQVYYVHGYQANLLAAYSYFNIYIPPFTVIEGWGYNMDTNVYQEYAGRLIPQAISYSAGLLNYFFRGKLDAQPDGADGIKITNKSSETMSGTFELYYDDKDGNRKQAVGASWTLPLDPGEASERKTFTVPDDADEPGKYILAFRGTLGSESDAVAGKAVRLKTVPYVFIIQESAEIKGIPIEDDGLFPSPGIVIHEKSWGGCPQIVKGRFVVYGSIQNVRLKQIFRDTSTLKLLINGQTTVNNTWVTGSSTGEPKTWQVELDCFPNDSIGPPSFVDLPWLETQLTNGDIFTQPVIVFGAAGQVVYKRIFALLGFFGRGRYSSIIITDTTFKNLPDRRLASIPGLGTFMTSEQFKFVQANNHTLEESYNHNYVDRGLMLNDRLEVGFIAGGSAGYYQAFDEPSTDCINTREQSCINYKALSLPEPFPVTLTAQMDRIYSKRELDHLKTKGIQPEYYSIIFK